MYAVKTLVLTLVLGISLAACSTVEKTEQAKLYDRLGGKEAITAVVNHLWEIAGKDERINHYFANTKPEVFGSQMIDFLCAASGGPCTYKGKNMHEAHVGMNISDADFDALAEDIVITLDHFKIASREKNEVMGLLNGMKLTVTNH